MRGSDQCPKCGGDSRITNSKRKNGHGYLRRSRTCAECDSRWTTIEVPEMTKTDGRKERVVVNGPQPILFLFEEKARRKLSTDYLSVRSGVSHRAIEKWKVYANGSIGNVIAVLEAMGCELVARRKEDRDDRRRTQGQVQEGPPRMALATDRDRDWSGRA